MTINKETNKAYQMKTEDGRVFWIQKRWLREDGTLTPAGEKAKAAARVPAQGIKLETVKIEVPEEIREMAFREHVSICDDIARKSGKWIVIDLMNHSGPITRDLATGIKAGIREITGKPAFIKPELNARFARAGWLAE